ncbi:hypothetical protein EVB32_332 [Rhizobium phage RHph_TM39]|uniref:Uncharacterized protein n=2 Tax=Cuauhnahuacvirus TaxID=3044696 RepID=A0A7S5UZ08_9CAUD|nr:hypothetical protein PQC16_gp305 [Rhizobium phage RHph_TM30]YP_010671484.1 hypothetical protein PQC17_gp306 [Rhizobium phage RHph_Y65]QIG71807.1 hypothetical protein EVB94_356 [Rhizobium phage RHph_TM40]QIG72167.1 hypothetical protein EVB95_354 [Rhizobium phage RHph_TM2_3B]QIG72530.1 hypothetical protein EVB96_354 [Rhizobium phage RHph_TM3_3_6]QIG77300.1 hypothetical protein EVB32_332 [Rhizobium phage RHph_TM39]QIG77917.1 hypothetical protein EVB64_351 [Rhizobium phage RHph_TM61]
MAKKTEVKPELGQEDPTRVIEYTHTFVEVSASEPSLLYRSSEDRKTMNPVRGTIVVENDTGKRFRYKGEFTWDEV